MIWQEQEMLADPRAWASRAACAGVDPEVFFERAGWPHARRLCAACPVVPECQADVDMLEADMWVSDWAGLWAGEDPVERAARRGVELPRPASVSPIGRRKAAAAVCTCGHRPRTHFRDGHVRLCTARGCDCRVQVPA